MSSRHLLIVAVVGLFSSAHADTIYVDDDNCPGPGEGTEGNPYCSIQTAIDNAVDTDEIVVAPGTYFETIDFLGKAITLRSLDGVDVTIIEAQGFDPVVTCDSAEGPGTVLEGFTITGGFGESGCGMANTCSSPTVSNCTFVGNEGGGMWNTCGGQPTVVNCSFSDNGGGGLFSAGGMFNMNSDPIVVNCRFHGNLGIGLCGAFGGGTRPAPGHRTAGAHAGAEPPRGLRRGGGGMEARLLRRHRSGAGGAGRRRIGPP